ncbi:MAG: acyltransferase family protein [Erythrobacter sp.]|jgi:peptidoglycan/LPS O-acetylase OafA/YrhL|nr:acyltransferase family protein [Erythrobacter sp.]
MADAASPGALPDSRARYRPEIDGLRALAIAPVVLHHAEPELLPGGFVGVDIFFVISGYLITGIVATELAEGRFSLLRFWERRVRRIVPALAAMLAATSLAAWALLTPEDFTFFAKALVAASVFAANIHFAERTDYFFSFEGAQPLIHTWTLGVEEQFYIVFPLLMLVAFGRGGRRAMWLAVAAIGLASFALAVALAPRWPLAAFYLLPTRMWELMLGAACALLPRAPRTNGAAASAGIALILAGFVLIGPTTPAPGPMFLLPTVGTALVLLFSDRNTLAGRMLALRLPVLLGLASFGIYLWHQPVLFFIGYVHFGPLPLAAKIGGIALSVMLGWVSFRLIEQPVRRGRLLAGRDLLAGASVMGLALPLALGAAGYFGAVGPRSMAEAAQLGGLRPPLASLGISEPPDDPLAFVLYGDSHAAQYYAAATARFGPGALVSHSGCLSTGEFTSRSAADPQSEACRALPRQLTDIVWRRGIGTVIWAQRWERELFAAGTNRSVGLTTGAQGRARLLLAMERLAARLPAGTRIIIVGNSPTAWAAGSLFGKGWLRCRAWRNVTCADSYPASLAEGRAISAALRDFAAGSQRFDYVDAAAPLCPNGRCLLLQEGKLNYWDGSHMTDAAAARVMAGIALPQQPPALLPR